MNKGLIPITSLQMECVNLVYNVYIYFSQNHHVSMKYNKVPRIIVLSANT